jgi:DNA-binding NarL/FixJ family response regulator
MKTNIILYDDNEVLGNSLSILLNEESDMQVIAHFQHALNILDDTARLNPQVILMDIDMPEINGVDAVIKLRTEFTDLPVIMLTVFDDNDNIFNAICAGANGYLLKKNATQELPNAIRNVLTGGAPMTGSVARKVLQMLPGDNKTNNEFHLSHQEREVLRLLVDGKSYKMIAAELFISIDTVRFHIKKIYDKLHVHSATEAVSLALRKKLV